MKHSALPWSACHDGNCTCKQIWSKPDDHPVATVIAGDWGDTYSSLKIEPGDGAIGAKAVPYLEQIAYGNVPEDIAISNVRFIVTACNYHERLLQALKDLGSWITFNTQDTPACLVNAGILINQIEQEESCEVPTK